jgi:biopolymer transport protein ExbD
MRFLDDEPDIPPQINIVPMIDVIFSILAFFIVSSLFLTRSEGLDVNLPQASTSQLQRTEQITVTINKKGQIFLNKKSLELAQLETEVRQLIVPKQTSIVTLKADAEVNHGTVVKVMDRLRKIKEVKLAIATQKTE